MEDCPLHTPLQLPLPTIILPRPNDSFSFAAKNSVYELNLELLLLRSKLIGHVRRQAGHLHIHWCYLHNSCIWETAWLYCVEAFSLHAYPILSWLHIQAIPILIADVFIGMTWDFKCKFIRYLSRIVWRFSPRSCNHRPWQCKIACTSSSWL